MNELMHKRIRDAWPRVETSGCSLDGTFEFHLGHKDYLVTPGVTVNAVEVVEIVPWRNSGKSTRYSRYIERVLNGMPRELSGAIGISEVGE